MTAQTMVLEVGWRQRILSEVEHINEQMDYLISHMETCSDYYCGRCDRMRRAHRELMEVWR